MRLVGEKFGNDTQLRSFSTFLERDARYYAATPFGLRFLSDCKERLLPPVASRSNYERMLRYTLHYSDEEIEVFCEAWREMLKTQF